MFVPLDLRDGQEVSVWVCEWYPNQVAVFTHLLEKTLIDWE